MSKFADLKAEDHHIRVGEAFVRNQKRIISERAKLGLSTTKDEHWLAVFSEGLVRHKMRRAEILDELNNGAGAPSLFPDTIEIAPCYYGLRDLGVDHQKYLALS